MNLRAFSAYYHGNIDAKREKPGESYALSLTDPLGRYRISAVACGNADGGIRSAAGAAFGCESAAEAFRNFFESPALQEGSTGPSEAAADELKNSIRQAWTARITNDLRAHPLTKEESDMLPAADQQSEKNLTGLYGASLMAAGCCGDVFVTLHTGKGILLWIAPDGYYKMFPGLPESGDSAKIPAVDPAVPSESWKCRISAELPQAVLLMSAEIVSCLDALDLYTFSRSIFTKLQELDQEQPLSEGLNAAQNKYLDSWLKFLMSKGKGVREDCALAGILNRQEPVSEVKLPLPAACRLWEEMAARRNHILDLYNEWKCGMALALENRLNSLADQNGSPEEDDRRTAVEEIRQLRNALQNTENRAPVKAEYYDKKILLCASWIRLAGGVIPAVPAFRQPLAMSDRYARLSELLDRVTGGSVKSLTAAVYDPGCLAELTEDTAEREPEGSDPVQAETEAGELLQEASQNTGFSSWEQEQRELIFIENDDGIHVPAERPDRPGISSGQQSMPQTAMTES